MNDISIAIIFLSVVLTGIMQLVPFPYKIAIMCMHGILVIGAILNAIYAHKKHQRLKKLQK